MTGRAPLQSGFAQLRRTVARWGGLTDPEDGATAAAPPVTGQILAPTLADRFEMRRRTHAMRLTDLSATLPGADPARARDLLREAESIAHVFAGTAAMFGQVRLGKVARQVEAQIRAGLRDEHEAAAVAAVARLILALSEPPQQVDQPAAD